MSEPGDSPACLNCGAALGGQYCAVCGQRATSRLISLWELVRDAFGDLFEVDSRLWRTIVPLLIKPGLLTKDYLEGRRARYMPPFRMYLVLSLLFFVVAFFDPREDLAILYEPDPVAEIDAEAEESTAEDAVESAATETVEAPGEDDSTAHREEARARLEALVESGVIHQEVLDEFDASADDDSDEINITLNGINFGGENCTIGEFDLGDAPGWLQRRLTPERVVETCERMKAAGKRGFARAVLDNIPAGLIVLLPFMALILKMLYPLSRRYYVEHLLFFVHFHSFFFLLICMQIMLDRIGDWIGFFEWLFTLVIVAAAFYIPAYLFVAMRRVYGQGRILTFLKYVVLVATYFVGFLSVMLGAVLIAVFSI